MKVAIIGAGPAGLSAGYILAKKGVKVNIFEKDGEVGGISKTVVSGDYRFDLGGHRFFTKDNEISGLIDELLNGELINVNRKSRIYFKNRYFDYPLQGRNAVFGLGITTAILILLSFLWQRTKRPFGKNKISTLYDWVVDKFGYKMFELYFKSYTEKVWGIPCQMIEAEWVAQRIKGMSLSKAIKSAFLPSKKNEPATLLRNFKYPKLGIGRISERMAELILRNNELFLNAPVTSINVDNEKIISFTCKNGRGGDSVVYADSFISSMPINELINSFKPLLPENILQAAKKLRFRDFIAVVLMLDKPKATEDTWLYIHEPKIGFGRIHEPKNWSPYMSPSDKTSLVMEYFCFESDPIWAMPDKDLAEITRRELVNKLGFITDDQVIGYKIVRIKKAYPMYELGYKRHLDILMDYLSRFKNLQLIGRNGTFRYNNMDHSIEMGLRAAKKLLGEDQDVLGVNTSDEYLEEIKS